MAVETSPRPVPVYHSPTSSGHGRQRRGSGRRSFTSTALPPTVGSPRTLCPRDGDTFSYKPNHLPRWYVPQELWERLPLQLQSALAAMQHAGAAVLTGFERLEHHSGDLDIGPAANQGENDDELLVQLYDSIPSLPLLAPLQTESMSSSLVLSSPSSGSGSPSSLPASSLETSPISPICLTPADAYLNGKHDRSRERSFSTPLEPHNAYYATELSQLRTESLPRLRHAVRKVDTEWYDVKRNNILTSTDVNDFENWWADKKCTTIQLDERSRRLSHAMGLSPTGMGWTAP